MFAEKYLQYFYATPYAVVLGNNLKTFKHVTPNRCARLCMEEAGFVCRSFDYQVSENTTIPGFNFNSPYHLLEYLRHMLIEPACI